MKEIVADLRSAPHELASLVAGLSAEQLTTQYISGEWTIAQNIHHLADSQLTLFFRFKLVLLVENPVLQPFDQDEWALSSDSMHPDISGSLAIISGVHSRLAYLVDELQDEQLERTGLHPENGTIVLKELAAYIANHAYLHIEQIKQSMAVPEFSIQANI